MPEAVALVLLLSRLAVPDRVRVFPRPKLDPSPLLPVGLNVQIDAKLFSLPIEVDLVV
jgi:hypothetical protein